MTTGQKASLSLLIAVLLFAAFAVAAFSGLFDLIEAEFYNPALSRQYASSLDAIAAAAELYHELNFERFASVLAKDSLKRSFLPNLSAEDAFERANAIGKLLEETPGLVGLRIIDSNGRRIHFSSFPGDRLRSSELETFYRNYGEAGDEAYADLAAEESSKGLLRIEAGTGRFSYSLPFADGFGVYRGTAVFLVSEGGLTDRLLKAGLLSVGEAALAAGREGIIFKAPGVGREALAQRAAELWAAGLGAEPLTLAQSEGGESYVLFSSAAKGRGGRLGLVVPASAFVFPEAMRILLLGAFFLTAYLLAFLLLNLRQDRMAALSERIKRFQIVLLEEYLDRKTEIDFGRWKSELEARRLELRTEIKRSVGGVSARREGEVDELIDKSWDEILAVLGRRAEIESIPSGASIKQVERLIAEALKRSNFVIPAGILAEGLPAEATAAPSRALSPVPSPARPSRPPSPRPSAAAPPPPEAEELEEVAEAEDVEDLGEVEELAEAEELEEVAEAEDVEDLGEVEELAEAEEVEDAGEAEELAEAEEVEELGEVEELAEAEEIEEEAAEAEETEVVEEAEAIEELAEVAEFEEAHSNLPQVAEAPLPPEAEADEGEELEALEEVEALEVTEALEEAAVLEEAAELEEPEEAEVFEEGAVLEETEALEEAAVLEEAAELEEAQEPEEAAVLEEAEELEEVEELEEAEAASLSPEPLAAGETPAAPSEELEILESFEPERDGAEAFVLASLEEETLPLIMQSRGLELTEDMDISEFLGFIDIDVEGSEFLQPAEEYEGLRSLDEDEAEPILAEAFLLPVEEDEFELELELMLSPLDLSSLAELPEEHGRPSKPARQAASGKADLSAATAFESLELLPEAELEDKQPGELGDRLSGFSPYAFGGRTTESLRNQPVEGELPRAEDGAGEGAEGEASELEEIAEPEDGGALPEYFELYTEDEGEEEGEPAGSGPIVLKDGIYRLESLDLKGEGADPALRELVDAVLGGSGR